MQPAFKSSLNKSVRIQELSKIVEENKILLKKLQNTQANYSTLKWEQQHRQKAYLAEQMRVNSCRFSKNPYFLHSLSAAAGVDSLHFSGSRGELGRVRSSKRRPRNFSAKSVPWHGNRAISAPKRNRAPADGALELQEPLSNTEGLGFISGLNSENVTPLAILEQEPDENPRESEEEALEAAAQAEDQ